MQPALTNHQGVNIAGDFNVNWADPESPNMQSLTRVTSTMDLTQLVTDITRQCPLEPENGTIIDLVFTDQPHLVSDLTICPNPVGSDHQAIRFDLKSNHV